MLAWSPYSTAGGSHGSARSEGLARELGIRGYFIHYLAYQRPWVAPVKYPLQAAATTRLLWRERPAVILVQNPPVVAPLVAAFYAAVTGAGFIVDSHSGAFLVRRWRWSLPLQRWLARRALATVVTNATLAAIVHGWRAPTLVAVDPPISMRHLVPRARVGQYSLVMVNTFSEDEPIAEVLQAARALPDVHFAITGDPAHARHEWVMNAPPNVEFTGFLPREDYEDRLRTASAVLVLTTLDHTLPRGAWEAIDLGQPLIVSDWPILREHFHSGSVHVENTSESIVAGVGKARAREAELRTEMLVLRDEWRLGWEQPRQELERLINSVWFGG